MIFPMTTLLATNHMIFPNGLHLHQMTKMMKSPVILPIHFGTFHQSSEPVWEPIHRLMKYTEGIEIVGTKVGYRFKL